MVALSLPLFSKADETVKSCSQHCSAATYIADMRIRFALPILLNLVFLASGSSSAPDLALIGAKIYPAPTESPIENGSILIHDGQVLAVGSSPTIKIPRDATVIDCKGLVVTAGFWNSHVISSLPVFFTYANRALPS
jgi:adenine deaminase